MYSLGRREVVIGVVTVFALPPTALLGAAALDIALSGTVVAAIVGAPLFVVALGLAYLARAVASRPDEPSLIDEQLGEALDMTSEEYRELTEEKP
ncbi:MAG: hypothetical protein U5K28_03295 [Halobacteriales archaeon]|nr:hypothetical protein [Halobacteriales archaeon]